ncbi:TonB family protein [Oceaniglobus ichthyenteri]|uniref:TonB family protein n=1 Tax=Oceaniglobus ichthyenteri TaxID=2136177 RepID=UPI000D3D0AC4|nr:TonB family protein [Oceaniglobus ichthyenteri]
MRTVVEFTAFLAIAAAVHVGLVQEPGVGGAQSAGAQGNDAVTLAASPPSVSDMVAQWDRPVQAVQQIAQPEMRAPAFPAAQPRAPVVQSAPTPRQIAPMIAPPDTMDMPTLDTTVPAPPTPVVETSPRPPKRPAPSVKTRKTPVKPAPSAPRQTAAGAGRKAASGTKGTASAPTQKQAANPALMAQWGGRIRSAIERRKRYPAGVRGGGKVTLAVAVSTSGGLSSVGVRRSSGNAALDQAAVSAVRRARFPAAPKGMGAGVHNFSLVISFDR